MGGARVRGGVRGGGGRVRERERERERERGGVHRWVPRRVGGHAVEIHA